MTDWKSALAALGATEEPNDNKEKTDIDRKKRVGVVYSTNPDYEYSDDSQEEADTLPKNQQKLRLNMERAGRGGKTVTLVKGFVGSTIMTTTLRTSNTLAKCCLNRCMSTMSLSYPFPMATVVCSIYIATNPSL